MYKRLYIIGNGFDLHYELRTSFEDFGAFVRQRDVLLANDLESLFQGDMWGSFEESLGLLSPDDVVRDCFGLLIGIDKSSNGFDDKELAAWSYQLEAMREVLSWDRINALFEDWVGQIDIPSLDDDGVVEDDGQTCYLTFNYTETLEKAFGVDPSRVLHVHGSVGDSLIFGHAPVGESELVRVDFNYHEAWEVEECRQIYIRRSEKPVGCIISENEVFFGELADVEEIIVAGFGFWDVDLPYISRICDATPRCPAWKVYWHSGEDRKRAERAIVRHVSFARWPS